ncbi:hypothetical protein RS85_02830 [Microbacterium sp. SA39]|nr:hypothetical protein RS85_02830 [Microbacterium sp. SA39]
MRWTYQIDPAYDPRGEIPGEAVISAAPCDDAGNVTGPWQQNPNYRPTVLAQLLSSLPADRFVIAFGAYLRGEYSRAQLRGEFEKTEFHALATEDRESLLVIDEGDGPAYSLFTTRELLPRDSPPPTIALRGSQILPIASNCRGFVINRSTFGSLWLPTADLLED